jgi:hypothetical protein
MTLASPLPHLRCEACALSAYAGLPGRVTTTFALFHGRCGNASLNASAPDGVPRGELHQERLA